MSCICTTIPTLDSGFTTSILVLSGKSPSQILIDVADDLKKSDTVEVITVTN